MSRRLLDLVGAGAPQEAEAGREAFFPEAGDASNDAGPPLDHLDPAGREVGEPIRRARHTSPEPHAGAPVGSNRLQVATTTLRETPAKPLTEPEHALLGAWLQGIGEDNPAIIANVLAQCERDPEARRYFLGMAPMDRTDDDGGARVAKPLTDAEERIEAVAKPQADRDLHYVIATHADVDPDEVILTLGIPGKGVGEIRITRSRYDAFALLELIEKHTTRANLQ